MKILRAYLIVILMLGVAFAVAPQVQAQEPEPGEGGYYTCQQFADGMSGVRSAYTGSTGGTFGEFEPGTYTFTFTNIDAVGATVRLVSDGSGSPASTLAGPISVPGTLTYDMPPLGSQPGGLGFYFDSGNEGSVQVTVTCSTAPGCAVTIPPQAVSGAFVENAEIYWAPGQLVAPQTVIEAGKTYLVAGQDASGMYRKVLIACQWVWVRAETVGPNYDEVWNGTPLPADVVE